MNDKRIGAGVPIEHAMVELGLQDSKEPVLQILATSPLKKPDDIDRLLATHNAAPEVPAGLMKQTILACETQEEVIYKQYRPSQGAKRAIADHIDKSHKTLAIVGGMSFVNPSGYMGISPRLHWAMDEEHITDERADENMMTHAFVSGAGIVYYTDCELWQIYEVDDEQGFKTCEALMESQILKGRGAEVYYEYARS